MDEPRILAFAGSLRKDSFNKKIIAIAAAGATNAGAAVTLIDLRDFPLPIFDADIEAESGFPANVVALKQLFRANDGLLLSCPEYNSSITAVFKNTIDWVSRPSPADTIGNKIVTLMSASTGALGGLRGLVHVRSIFGNLNTIVLPGQVAITHANDAFTDAGQLKDAAQQAKVEALGANLAAAIRKWKS